MSQSNLSDIAYGLGVELAQHRNEAEMLVASHLLLNPIRSMPIARRTGVVAGIYRTPSCRTLTGGVFAESDLALIAAASMHVGASGQDFPVSARVARLALTRARLWSKAGHRFDRGPTWCWSSLMAFAFEAVDAKPEFAMACEWLVDVSGRADRAARLMREAADLARGGSIRPMRIAKAVA